MSTEGWSRVSRPKRGRGKVDANDISISTIVSYYGGEVREGKNLSVRCVLHNDTRKSAVIDTKDNLYYCHTCGKGGNAVNIISIKENMEFKDALARAVEILTRSGNPIQQGSKRRSSRVSRRSWDI